MEFENLLKLVECVSASGLDSFYYEQGETTIKMKKSGIGMQTAAAVSSCPDGGKPDSQNATCVKSPLVGIFYAAPGEDAPPFVSVGDTVKKGQTLGIVEAMKLMNEIECECDGIVKEIPVENGQAVEYGQPLFVIAPCG